MCEVGLPRLSRLAPSGRLCEEIHKLNVKNDSAHKQVSSALNEGWVEGGSFFGSVLAGALLGSLLDWWLGTDPWLVVTGIVVGSYSGFLRMWQYMKKMDDKQ